MNIRLHFHKFWGKFTPEQNIWYWALSQKHNVTLDSVNPNLVISQDGKPFPDVFTIYFSNEPYFPTPEQIKNSGYDHSMSNFLLDIPNYTRFPSYYFHMYDLINGGILKDFTSHFNKLNRDIPDKSEFCVFVSKSLTGKRGRFFEKLNKYKKIHTNVSPYTNISIGSSDDGAVNSLIKTEFIKKYKFNLAFENNFRGSHPCFPGAIVENGELLDLHGLTSEKLIEPLVAGTIPLYWGNKFVGDEFNSKTFLSYYDYESEDEFIEKIIELDNDDDLYNSYFKESISLPTKNHIFHIDYVVSLFDDILKKIN